MSDGFDEAETHRAKLTYPFAEGPALGAAVDVAPDVKWMRLPLGGSLAFINVWAIRDGGGWAVVDTGMRTHETAAAWRRIFSEVFHDEPVTRVFVTHMHPDHVGLAGWIARKHACRLWMTRLEYMTCRVMAADTGREAPEDGLRFYRGAGWDQAALDHYHSRFGGFGKMLYPLPDSFRRLSDGEDITIGEHVWRVVIGNGHSPEHACLYCPDLKLMISGDQVLPRISSNVSVFPTEPDADPLRDWLTSLALIKTKIPDDVLVAPAHNDPFYGLHARIDHLIEGHERGLAQVEKRLSEPHRAVDVFGALFKRVITSDHYHMATGEAVAHLNCLMQRGKIARDTDADGVQWYRAA